jgi:hypothetical protein
MATANAAEKTPPAGETAATEETPAAETEAAAEETAAEGETAEGGEEAAPVETTDKPAEGEAETPAEAKPLNELTPDELQAQLTPEQLMKVAHRFANKTMAAARRAEREVETVRGQNEQLTGQVSVYQGFVDQFQSDPMSALRRLPGFTTLRDFVERCTKGGAAAPKPEDDIAELKKWRADREAADRRREDEAQSQASQERVFSALEKEPDRFDLVLTDDGRTKLWNSIVAYRAAHGRVPNEKVFEMAEAIEERMTASLAKSKKFAQAQSAKTGDSAAASARPAASKTGAKTITNRSSSSGIVVRDYSKMTEKERDAAILADMYASGELTRV